MLLLPTYLHAQKSQLQVVTEQTSGKNPGLHISSSKAEYCSNEQITLKYRLRKKYRDAQNDLIIMAGSHRGGMESFQTQKLVLEEVGEGEIRVDIERLFSTNSVHSLNIQWLRADTVFETSPLPIVIKPSPTLSMTPFPKVCANGPSIKLDNIAPKGGTYSGYGITDGYFVPTGLDPAGYEVTYTYQASDGCSSSLTDMIEIIPVPLSEWAGIDTFLCENENGFFLPEGKPEGGYHIGLGVDSSFFNPSIGGWGQREVGYVIEMWGCKDTATDIIDVLPLPDIRFTEIDPTCVGRDTLLLTATPYGGKFFGEQVNHPFFVTNSLAAGLYDVYYEVSNEHCQDTASLQIELVQKTVDPIVQTNGDSLWIDEGFVNIQWWFEDELMLGKTDRFLRPEKNGEYHVRVGGRGNCQASSKDFAWNLTPEVVEKRMLDEWILYFPEPTSEYAVIDWAGFFPDGSQLRVYNDQGRLMRRQYLSSSSDVFAFEVDKWNTGTYEIRIKVGPYTTRRSFLVR
ncbi:MAG: hypothetical protein AAFY71_26675 [Bacteroidota bacterium]